MYIHVGANAPRDAAAERGGGSCDRREDEIGREEVDIDDSKLKF